MAAAGIQLYERMSQAVMNHEGSNVLGTYQVRITNRVGRKTARIYGNIARVLGPAEPVIDKDLKDLAVGILSDEDNTLELKVEATTDEHSFVQYLVQRSKTAADASDYETVSTSKQPSYTILGQDYAEGVDDGDGFYKEEDTRAALGRSAASGGERCEDIRQVQRRGAWLHPMRGRCDFVRCHAH